MATILKIVAALIVIWFVWIKYQQTRWRHVADDLLFETYKELMAADFDTLVARAGQPHETKTRKIRGHRFKVGWRVDKVDAHPGSFAGVSAIDDSLPSDVRPDQRPWIREVEVWMFVDFMAMVPFVADFSSGPSLYIRRNRDGIASSVRPVPDAYAFPVKSRLMYLADLTVEDAARVADGDSDSAITIAACADATAGAKGYCSYITDGTSEADERLKWLLDFEKPDRFQVLQVAGDDIDGWIAIGRESFRYLGDWFHMPGEDEPAAGIGEIFVADRYLEMLRSERPVSARLCRFVDRRPFLLTFGRVEIGFGSQNAGEREFVLVEYEMDTIGLDDFDGQKNGPWQVTLWIDRANGMLARMDAGAEMPDEDGGYSDFLLKQVFVYTSPSVSRPENYQELE